MEEEIPMGTRRVIDGQPRVYYYSYWIKAYAPPAESLVEKKRLIEQLTRRLFNHVEHGLNVPASRLEEARRAFEQEQDPKRQRVRAGMLAGALFNRAGEMFTKLVELQSQGVQIHANDALMRECGEHLKEALTLGKSVLHRSGEEGIDELWGEPFKAFAFPIAEFYETRYVKVAQAMGAIDRLTAALIDAFEGVPEFGEVPALALEFSRSAKAKAETPRTDPNIFDVWTDYVVSGERLAGFTPGVPAGFTPGVPAGVSSAEERWAALGTELIADTKNLITHIVSARVPMPKSARALVERCERFRDLGIQAPRSRVERVA